jgi:hypothetical protein
VIECSAFSTAMNRNLNGRGKSILGRWAASVTRWDDGLCQQVCLYERTSYGVYFRLQLSNPRELHRKVFRVPLEVFRVSLKLVERFRQVDEFSASHEFSVVSQSCDFRLDSDKPLVQNNVLVNAGAASAFCGWHRIP